MATPANSSREARRQARESKVAERNSKRPTGPAVSATLPVFALVLALVPGEPPHAKVLFENRPYEKTNGDHIENIAELQDAVIAHVGGSVAAFRREYEGDPLMFAEDPRDGGSCTDRRTSNPRPLTINIEEDEGVHSGHPVDSAHRTFPNPYFVLVRRKLVAAAGGFADVEEKIPETLGDDLSVELTVMRADAVVPFMELLGWHPPAGTGSVPVDYPDPDNTTRKGGMLSAQAGQDDPGDFESALDLQPHMRFAELSPTPNEHDTSTLVADNDDSSVEATSHNHRGQASHTPDLASRSPEEIARALINAPLGAVPSDRSEVLSQALPIEEWEAANARFLPRFLGTADANATKTTLWNLVRRSLLSQEQDKFMIVAAGTSGVGKTKAAYDLSLSGDALVIFATASRKRIYVAPFEKLVAHITTKEMNAQHYPAHAKQYKEQARNAYLLLLIAYLEWALRLLREASTVLDQMGEAQKNHRQILLLQLALRPQNTAEADRCVCEIFETLLGFESHTFGQLKAMFMSRADEVRRLVGVPIVFCHDEAQALLREQFVGCFQELHERRREHIRTTSSPPGGMLYLLCLLISEIRDVQGVAHVLCGTNLELTQETVQEYSPAQGMTEYISVATSLDTEQIRTWFASYLTPEAQQGLTTDLLSKLRGRPLFASRFWYCLLDAGNMRSSPTATVRAALERAAEQAVGQAKSRVRDLWNQSERRTLLKSLYISMKLGFGTELKALPPSWTELRFAILRGVLNVDLASLRSEPAEVSSDDHTIDLSREPPTALAIFQVCEKKMRHTTWIADPFREVLVSPWLGLYGYDACKGQAYEELFVWRMLKERLKNRSGGISLAALFEGCGYSQFWPGDVAELKFRATRALRCDLFDDECLELLLQHGDTVVLHFTPTNGKCADIMFLVRRKDGTFRLVIIQVKNRSEAAIPEAMASLDMGRWFPDHPNSHGRETNAHYAFRNAFAKHSAWFADPVRVVLHHRQFHDSILRPVAYINALLLPRQPIVLATIPADFLSGADVGQPDNPIHNVENPSCFTATPLRHWDRSRDGNHPHEFLTEVVLDIPDNLVFTRTVSMREPTEGSLLDALLSRFHHTRCKKRTLVNKRRDRKLLVQFTYLSDAIYFVTKARKICSERQMLTCIYDDKF